MDQFSETQLPPKSAFFNDLSQEPISDADYQHVTDLWDTFNLQTLGDLCELYCKSDVLLLSCIIDKYRDTCLTIYGLDPVHYYSAPALTWDAGLKFTGVELQLLKDRDMYIFLEQCIRCGISTVTHRFAMANNPQVSNFDPSLPTSWLMYLDANNLYG